MTPIPAKPINELKKKTWVSNQDSILIVDSVTWEARLADKEELRGAQGTQGEKGDDGAKGDRGDVWPKWEQGLQGIPWPVWPKGDKGDPFKYSDFTTEQLQALKGAKWDRGERWPTWPQGERGLQGIPWPKWENGNWTWDMLKANNLSDIPDKAQARANLELYSIAQITALLQNMLTSENLNSVARTLAWLTVIPGNWSVSASIFLRHPNWRTYEFFSDGSWAFGVWDKTSDQNVFKMNTEEAIFFRRISANNRRIVNVANPVDWQDALNKQYLESQKNQANGIAGLDNNKKLDPSVIPLIATTETVTVANEAARLALTTAQVQRGDYVVQTDTGAKFILGGNNPKNKNDWIPMSDTTPDWSQIANKPSSFAPSPHSHTKASVGLGKVDNTSDAEKNSAVATLTNKTISWDNNTITKVNSLKNQNGNTEIKTRAGTKAQHTAIGTKDANTLYFVTES